MRTTDRAISTFTVLSALLLTAALLPAQGIDPAEPQPLTVYAYDSFVSEWGPGPAIGEAFREASGIPIEWVSAGDSGQVLQRAIFEKANPRADIIIGIDNSMLSKALAADILLPYQGDKLEELDEKLIFDESRQVIPYDYGYFSIIANTSEVSGELPTSLEELTEERFSRQLILMDPRTSSPGLGFLLWTVARFGDGYLDYWQALKPSILTITDGWDSGYGLFLSGEAPYVLSYTTSPAYHAEFETAGIYEAVLFNEGHYAQIEGAGILKGTQQPEKAKEFIDFLLGSTAQEVIPLTNWMYPVNDSIVLPDSYAYAPEPDKTLMLPFAYIADNLERILDDWTELMSQ